MTLTTSGPDVSRDAAATGERLTTGATVLLVAWGALAIGAVYPWGYVPLATGCALAGAFALQRARRDIAAHRGIVFSLAAVALAIALQLLPLPETVRAVVSPRLDGVLAQLDLGFALQTAAAGAEGALTCSTRSRWMPLPPRVDSCSSSRSRCCSSGSPPHRAA
jgi:hypothetical protein